MKNTNSLCEALSHIIYTALFLLIVKNQKDSVIPPSTVHGNHLRIHFPQPITSRGYLTSPSHRLKKRGKKRETEEK